MKRTPSKAKQTNNMRRPTFSKLKVIFIFPYRLRHVAFEGTLNHHICQGGHNPEEKWHVIKREEDAAQGCHGQKCIVTPHASVDLGFDHLNGEHHRGQKCANDGSNAAHDKQQRRSQSCGHVHHDWGGHVIHRVHLRHRDQHTSANLKWSRFIYQNPED